MAPFPRRLRLALLAFLSPLLLPAGAAALPFVPGSVPELDVQIEVIWNVPTSVIPSGPEGLAFGPGMAVGPDEDMVDRTGEDVLFVSQGDSCDTGGCAVAVYTTDGKRIPGMGFSTASGTFLNPGVGAVRGLDMLPNGNLLATLTDQARVTEIFATGPNAGQVVPGGIDFQTPVQVPVGNFEPESVILNTDGRDGGANTVFVGHEEAERVIEYALQSDGTMLGTELSSFDFFDSPFNDPSGMAFDPGSGLLFVADDSSGGEDSRIFVFDADGNLVSATDLLKVLTDQSDPRANGFTECSDADVLGDPPNCNDPEGLAWDPSRQFLFVAFEDQQLVLGLSGAAAIVPEPGAALLVAVGLALALRRRRGA